MRSRLFRGRTLAQAFLQSLHQVDHRGLPPLRLSFDAFAGGFGFDQLEQMFAVFVLIPVRLEWSRQFLDQLFGELDFLGLQLDLIGRAIPLDRTNFVGIIHGVQPDFSIVPSSSW